MQNALAEEILDLVDYNDNVIGSLERSKIYASGLRNFRVINCFIINSRGQLWIPRRTAQKKLFPLCLDVSVGGHVSSGETYHEAFAREVLEEVRIDIESVRYKKVDKLVPHIHGVSAFMEIFFIYSDITPSFNESDFIEYYWLSPCELIKKMSTSDHGKVKGDLPFLVNYFFNNNTMLDQDV